MTVWFTVSLVSLVTLFIMSSSTSTSSSPPGLFRKLKFFVKGFFALNILLLSATYGVISSLTLALVGKRSFGQWTTARFFYHLLSCTMGLKINVDRPQLLRNLPAILVSNHQSELDIYMLGRIFPPGCVVTAKKQLKYFPFLGWFMSASGTFFLDRSNREKAISTLQSSLNSLKQSKGGLFIFPEGTRCYSSTPTLMPFKKGAFHLAVQAQIPVVPLVVSNTSNIYSMKLFNFNRGEINIKVLDPIPTVGLTKDDVPQLTQLVHDRMNQAVKELGMSVVYGEECKKKVEGEEEEEEEVEQLEESINESSSLLNSK